MANIEEMYMTMPNVRKKVSDVLRSLCEMIRNKQICEAYEYLDKIGVRAFLTGELAAYLAEGGERLPFKARGAKSPANKEGVMRKALYNQQSLLIGDKKVFLFYEEASTKKSKQGLGGSVDLLGVDEAGRMYLLELKHSRDKKTSVLETLLQVLTYRAYFAYPPSREWWKQVFTSEIEKCGPEDDLRKNALHKARTTRRRSFAALAMLQEGMNQLEAEKQKYLRLLDRGTNRLAPREIVGVVSVKEDDCGRWQGKWVAGCPTSRGW